MTDININDLRQILCHYGREAQKDKLKEELNELIEAVEDQQENDCELTNDHYIEELADVSIMVEQMILAMDISEQCQYYSMINYKIDRQLRRIENEKS